MHKEQAFPAKWHYFAAISARPHFKIDFKWRPWIETEGLQFDPNKMRQAYTKLDA